VVDGEGLFAGVGLRVSKSSVGRYYERACRTVCESAKGEAACGGAELSPRGVYGLVRGDSGSGRVGRGAGSAVEADQSQGGGEAGVRVVIRRGGRGGRREANGDECMGGGRKEGGGMDGRGRGRV